MKKIILSAVAVMSISGAAFAADTSASTIADAFEKGKVSGAVQAYYWGKDTGSLEADILSVGFDVSYETAKFHGFSLKSTFQFFDSALADDDSITKFSGDMYGTGGQLSEAYISYAIAKSTVQAGRIYMGTPLVAASGSRINKESFSGAVVTNSDIPDTKITLAYAGEYQTRTNSDGGIGEFDSIEAAYTVAVKNTSVEGLKLTAAYLDQTDTMTVAYAEAAYKYDMFNAAAQYYFSDEDANTDTSDFVGVKAGVKYNDISAMLAYSTVGDDVAVKPGVGNGADLAYTNSPILSSYYTVDTQCTKVSLGYAIAKAANVGANYIIEDNATTSKGYASVTGDYAFSGALKGFKVAVIYDAEIEDGDDSAFRINTNYAF